MTDRTSSRAIIHLDMDAFYPSVECLDNPNLKGKPVIVGGGRQRGVVSSASYEARRFGVHSAQPIAAAMRLCPHGVFLPVRMSRYKEVSDQVFEIFRLFTPLVEPLSIDEAFLDVTGSIRLFGRPEEIAGKIKQAVVNETGLTVSAGVAPSKFVAKIASDLDKPDGLTVVRPGKVREFLNPLPIDRMWGGGKKTQEALMRLNVFTFEDLSRISTDVLVKIFGKHGLKMHLLSLGIDNRDVVTSHEARSIGHEETFLHDIMDQDEAKRRLLALAGKVARRMRGGGVTGKTVTLKVKYSDFVQVTRSTKLYEPVDDSQMIYSTACSLLGKTRVGTKPVRLLGISVSTLSFAGREGQLSLFQKNALSERRAQLNKAVDSICERFGEESILPGALISRKKRHDIQK